MIDLKDNMPDDPLHDAEMQRVLGIFSSHPKGMRWRSRLTFSLAVILTGWLTWKLVPLLSFHHLKGMLEGLFPAALIDKLMQSATAIPQEMHKVSDLLSEHAAAPKWSDDELWIWFGMAFLAGALVAAGLSDRWAAFQAKRLALKGFTKGESWPFPLCIGIGIVAVLFAFPVAAFALNSMPARYEMVADVTLITLLWSLLGWAGLSNTSNNERRLPFVLGAACFWAVPFYNSVVGFFSHGFGSIFGGSAGKVAFTSVAIPPQTNWALLAAGLISFLAWIFWPKSSRTKEQEKAAEETPIDHRAVVDEILASLRTEHRVLKPLDQILSDKTSPVSANPSFWPLFMHGLTPTNDQMTFFEKHRTGSLEFARRVEENLEQSDWWNGFNLLLAGHPGSGRTTALIAAALYSCAAGGATSLVIAPRPDKRRWLYSRIKDVLQASGMHTHFDCEELSAGGVLSIVQNGRAAPAILVATPQDLEDHVFGLGRLAEDPSDLESIKKSAEHNFRLEALVASMHSIFVENLSDFDPVPRSHLAFQLEKMRLRLAAKGRGLTTVVASPAVDEADTAVLGSRIFGETGFRPDRDVVALHPAPIEKTCLAVEIESSEAATLAEEIAEALLRKNLAAVLFRKGIDEESCSEQQRKISAAAGLGRLVVLGDLDQRFDGQHEFDSVVYQNLTTVDATLAVGLRFGGETTVVFHVRPSKASQLVEPEETAMPMVAGRDSPSLVAYHSLSFWSGLKAGDNVEKDWMRRLASEVDTSSAHKPISQTLAEMKETSAAPGTPWPELVALLRVAPAAFQPIMTAAVPDDDLALDSSRISNGARISLARKAEDAVSTSTKLHWVSAAGQSMAHWAIDHSPILLLRSEDGTFSAASVRANGGDIKITARHYAGKGDDLLLPAVNFEWEVPASASLEMIGGGTDFGARWFRVLDSQSSAKVQVSGRLCGLVSESGLCSSQSPVPFAFEAYCSPVLVGSITSDNPDDTQFLSGAWSTDSSLAGRAYLYETTHTLTAFLCSRFSGPANFCWPVVFNDNGRILVWLIEPATTGLAVSSFIFALLATADFREDMLSVIGSSSHEANGRRLPPAPRIGSMPAQPQRNLDSSPSA
jgi:hypothetical protein